MIYKQYDKIGKDIANKLIKIPNVKAIAYIGSMASGFVDNISKDIDIACFVYELPSIKERRKYLGKQDYSESSNIYLESFIISGIRIDIIFKELGWVEDTLRRMEPADDFAEKHNLFPIQNMKIIIDNGKVIEKLKKRVAYTDDYRRRKIEFLFAVLAHRKFVLDKPLKRKNIAFVDFSFSDAMEKYVAALFALNKKYYSDLKWSERFIQDLKIKPKSSLKYLNEISVLGNRPVDIKKKIIILKKMTEELSETIKKYVPEAKINSSLEELEGW